MGGWRREMVRQNVYLVLYGEGKGAGSTNIQKSVTWFGFWTTPKYFILFHIFCTCNLKSQKSTFAENKKTNYVFEIRNEKNILQYSKFVVYLLNILCHFLPPALNSSLRSCFCIFDQIITSKAKYNRKKLACFGQCVMNACRQMNW